MSVALVGRFALGAVFFELSAEPYKLQRRCYAGETTKYMLGMPMHIVPTLLLLLLSLVVLQTPRLPRGLQCAHLLLHAPAAHLMDLAAREPSSRARLHQDRRRDARVLRVQLAPQILHEQDGLRALALARLEPHAHALALARLSPRLPPADLRHSRRLGRLGHRPRLLGDHPLPSRLHLGAALIRLVPEALVALLHLAERPRP